MEAASPQVDQTKGWVSFMSSVANINSLEQAMVQPKPACLMGWTDGPLPIQALEQAALDLFTDAHPRGLWADHGYSDERNHYRRQVVRLYARFLTMERWTLSTMVDRCEAGMRQVVFGDGGVSEGDRRQLRDYAESCIEDLFRLFGGDAIATSLAESFKKDRVS